MRAKEKTGDGVMSESPHMIVESETHDYTNGVNAALAGLATVVAPLTVLGPFLTTGIFSEVAFLSLIGTSAAFPWLTKFIGGRDARRYNDSLAPLSTLQASPTFRKTKTLLSKDPETGKETYLIRNFKHAIIETHTPEAPGKTWDRVYESLLTVHGLKEADFLVYAQVAEELENTSSSHGKLLPWKHSINKAMAFTGYEIACECKACSR